MHVKDFKNPFSLAASKRTTSHMYEHIGHKPFGAPEELIEDVSPNRFSRCRPQSFLRVKHVRNVGSLLLFPCVLHSHLPERASRASAGKPKCWESSNICGRTLAPRA